MGREEGMLDVVVGGSGCCAGLDVVVVRGQMLLCCAGLWSRGGGEEGVGVGRDVGCGGAGAGAGGGQRLLCRVVVDWRWGGCISQAAKRAPSYSDPFGLLVISN